MSTSPFPGCWIDSSAERFAAIWVIVLGRCRRLRRPARLAKMAERAAVRRSGPPSQPVARPRKKTGDKLVYDLRVTLVGSESTLWRLVAVSADSTLPELHRTIQGAFSAGCVSEPCLVIGGTRYAGAKGSRTLLRRVIGVGDVLECHDAAQDRQYAAEVVRGYEVQSRRHHPKVLGGAGMPAESRLGDFDGKVATWCAQDASRGYYPVAASFKPFAAPPAEPKLSRNEPCPCGSGKKRKRCCGSSLRVV